jgi:putative ABC transport system substrate-binding protein
LCVRDEEWKFRLFAGAALLLPAVVHAQPPKRMYRIGVLGVYSHNAAVERVFEEFRLGMEELGWVEGKNFVRVYRWAEGNPDRLPALAAELVALKPDALLVGATAAAVALKKATSKIPIVAVAIGDPVELGLAPSFARPGNVTGPSVAFYELIGKQMELMKETLPHATRMAALYHSADPSAHRYRKYAEAAARQLGVAIEMVDVDTPDDFEGAFRKIRVGKADAVLVVASAFMYVHRSRLAALALQHRLPTMWNNPDPIEAGGLMCYGVNLPALWRRGAVFMDKILKGANPSNLPIERPFKFDLWINLKTAKALGITIPKIVLLRADRVIE